MLEVKIKPEATKISYLDKTFLVLNAEMNQYKNAI